MLTLLRRGALVVVSWSDQRDYGHPRALSRGTLQVGTLQVAYPTLLKKSVRAWVKASGCSMFDRWAADLSTTS